MNRGRKRSQDLPPEAVQAGNQSWWTEHPMTYDWHGETAAERYSQAWFDAMDRTLIHGARLFATDQQPFDRILPLATLAGKRVLEIGCGMGLHTETMARAGAMVTALDLTPTAVEGTRRRLALQGLTATVLQHDGETLPFPPGTFDFVWSWGVIHHSSRTARIVREIARVLTPDGECRVMVYNREGMSALRTLLRDHLLGGKFLRQTFDETLYGRSDGFSARFFVQEQFEDLFRAFFAEVESQICGQDVDVVPLPRRLRGLVLSLVPEGVQRAAQAKRGSFIFLRARRPS